MAFTDGSWVPGAESNSQATQLVSGDLSPNQVPEVAGNVAIGDGAGCLKVITAYYDLAQADNRILVEWLLRPRRKIPKNLRHGLAELLIGKLYRTQDVRYTLAEMLHSSAVSNAFDLVIIDCPPRLTTSEIQAFCASTHLLIPTIFDRPSAEAVVSLCDQVENLKKENICPHLNYIGVVGTKWTGGVANLAAVPFVKDALQARNLQIPILPQNTFVPQAAAMVNDAWDGIAYLEMPARAAKVRDAIEKLAETIAGQMGLVQPLPPPAPVNLPQNVAEPAAK